MVVGLADLRGEIDGVGVNERGYRTAKGRGCQQEGKKEAEDFDAAFYGSSPGLGFEASGRKFRHTSVLC